VIKVASFNKVMLMGNLTRDPELRYTSGGQAVCNFSLAINRYFNDKQGERKEETTFMRVTVWGKQGENCAQYLTKGRSAFVEGRLQSRSWETEDGQKRSAVDVVADSVQFIGGRGDTSDVTSSDEGSIAEDDIPF
jgi:single-strand DNA-binding protein